MRHFPVLAELSAPVRERLFDRLSLTTLPAGAPVFAEASPCSHFPLLLEGSIRVFKLSEGGRELLLYRVSPGGTCLISSSCLLSAGLYPAQARSEGQSTLALLPRVDFETLIRESAAFRAFVFGELSRRVTTLMMLVEEVAFHRLDERLAALLLQRGPEVAATHQQLADDLGSCREIVSRLLKDFEERQLVRLSRGRVSVLDADGLIDAAGRPS